jgi:hypothetical protein
MWMCCIVQGAWGSGTLYSFRSAGCPTFICCSGSNINSPDVSEGSSQDFMYALWCWRSFEHFRRSRSHSGGQTMPATFFLLLTIHCVFSSAHISLLLPSPTSSVCLEHSNFYPKLHSAVLPSDFIRISVLADPKSTSETSDGEAAKIFFRVVSYSMTFDRSINCPVWTGLETCDYGRPDLEPGC